MRGYDKLKEAVMKDCNEKGGCGCFNENGCNVKNATIGTYGEEGYKHCFHEYCDKFKWVIDRAKHYGEKLGIPWEEILDSWEEDRTYWYMNYYQDCEQPLIDSDDVFVFESAEEMRKKVGNEFICPSCKKIGSDPYECKHCGWKSYGFIQLRLTFIYCKKERKSTKCFMPKALADIK